jgi:hypothetical protein
MLQRVMALITVASLVVLAILLSTTIPVTAGALGLLTIFFSAYLACLGLISFFLSGVSKVMVYALSGFTLRKPLQPLPFRRAYYFSTVLAAVPVLLIGLQSVNAIGIYEVLLVVAFAVLGCVYISKRIR